MVSVVYRALGSRIAYDGGVWSVVALAGDRVTVEEAQLRTDTLGADRVSVVRTGHAFARTVEQPLAERPSVDRLAPMIATAREAAHWGRAPSRRDVC